MTNLQPSMAEAAKIRNVAARHAYVFDNGLSSPDFFDVEKRLASEEFGLLRERIQPKQTILEIGCFTGLNLLGLSRLGYEHLTGVDFVRGAITWALEQEPELNVWVGEFPPCARWAFFDCIICFDVLEHQRNIGAFIESVVDHLYPKDSGRRNAAHAYFLVPVGKEYYDCGHVAFFPDAECLRNVLDYVFEVDEIFELKTCKKLFASCRKRA